MDPQLLVTPHRPVVSHLEVQGPVTVTIFDDKSSLHDKGVGVFKHTLNETHNIDTSLPWVLFIESFSCSGEVFPTLQVRPFLRHADFNITLVTVNYTLLETHVVGWMTRTARKGRKRHLEATPWEDLCADGKGDGGEKEETGRLLRPRQWWTHNSVCVY